MAANGHIHKVLAEEQRRCSRTPLDSRRDFRIGARVLGRLDGRYLLQNAVRFGELAHAGFTIFEAVFAHHSAVQTVQNMEELVCIATEQRPCQHYRALTRGGHRP
jgi:hypothetical protein